MITTVTTVTTVTAIAAMGLTAAVSIAGAVILVLFLATKEVAGARGSSFPLRLTKALNVGILPLVMAFAVLVALTITEVLV